MANNCSTGITIPTLNEDFCGGKTTDTKCTIKQEAIPFLELPQPNNTLDVIIDNTVLSLTSVTNRVSDLENNINGSETKVTNGVGITITGTGTTSTPYVISASNPSSSATFTPSDGSYTTYNRSYWSKNGNVLELSINGIFNGGGLTTNVGHTIPLPNSFLIDSFIIDRVIGISPVITGIVGDSVGNVRIAEKSASSVELVFDVPTDSDDYYFSVKATVLIQ